MSDVVEIVIVDFIPGFEACTENRKMSELKKVRIGKSLNWRVLELIFFCYYLELKNGRKCKNINWCSQSQGYKPEGFGHMHHQKNYSSSISILLVYFLKIPAVCNPEIF